MKAKIDKQIDKQQLIILMNQMKKLKQLKIIESNVQGLTDPIIK